jgi:hypothetical protein
MINPFAGLIIALRCIAVNLGNKSPLVVLETSNTAEASGDVVPTPVCAKAIPMVRNKKAVKNLVLFFI